MLLTTHTCDCFSYHVKTAPVRAPVDRKVYLLCKLNSTNRVLCLNFDDFVHRWSISSGVALGQRVPHPSLWELLQQSLQTRNDVCRWACSRFSRYRRFVCSVLTVVCLCRWAGRQRGLLSGGQRRSAGVRGRTGRVLPVGHRQLGGQVWGAWSTRSLYTGKI